MFSDKLRYIMCYTTNGVEKRKAAFSCKSSCTVMLICKAQSCIYEDTIRGEVVCKNPSESKAGASVAA